MEPEVVSVAEAGRITNLGVTTLYKLMGEGRLTSSKLGKRRLIRVDSIRALLADAQVAA